MYIGLHHCLNVSKCVLVPVCCFYVSMDPRGLIQNKINEFLGFSPPHGVIIAYPWLSQKIPKILTVFGRAVSDGHQLLKK